MLEHKIDGSMGSAVTANDRNGASHLWEDGVPPSDTGWDTKYMDGRRRSRSGR